MNQRNICGLLLAFCLSAVQAQVGINTDTPNPDVMLDVNGKTNVGERIYLGGTDLAEGNPGIDKQVIISGGENTIPSWEEKKLPQGYGQSFTMTYMNTYYDENGLGNAILPESGTGVYLRGESMGADWKEIAGLTNDFVLYKTGSKVNFMFQTTAQLTSSASTSVSFACGLFIAPGKKETASSFTLRGVRVGVVQGTSGSFNIVNLTSTLDGSPSVDDLPGSPSGTWYTAKIACRARNRGDATLFAIGTPVDTSYLNQDMARSSLNIFVLEKW